MTNFKSNCLQFEYCWTPAAKECRYSIFSPEDIIDRTNGYQILDFINRFMRVNGLISQDSFSRIEKLICENMPEGITTRGDIKLWLSKNWNKN